MKTINIISVLLVLLLAACSRPGADADANAASDSEREPGPPYLVLDEDLTQLKYDFNSTVGKVRLLFLSGPTCGICLRGMADLNDAFIAAAQNDERLVTFVVHVPTLGAAEEHVADTIPLLDGPRVHHYWDDSGIIGRHYEHVMDVDIYVWDFWAVYGPDARWDGTLPPVPDYYEHQLGGFLDRPGGFPRDLMLDAGRFGRVTNDYLAQVDGRRYSRGPELDQSERELLADGTVIPVVAQPRNAAVRQHIINRGGYKNLKAISRITKSGYWIANGSEYALTVDMQRPRGLTKSVRAVDREYVSAVTSDGVTRQGEYRQIGLPDEFEAVLLRTYEFDGQLVEWPDKGSELAMIGMQKLGDVLAWKLDLTQASGDRRHVYVNSHGGAIVKVELLDANGDVRYSVVQDDVREVDGFLYPHRVEYRDAKGNTLAVEKFDKIEIEREDLEAADVVASQ